MTLHDRPTDDRLMPSLMIRGMDEGLRLLEALHEAEARQRRHERDLTSAREQTELARGRYEANRELVKDMWGTTRAELQPRAAVVVAVEEMDP